MQSKHSWSYSHYTLAANCARKWKHIVLDKKPSAAERSADVSFGSALHCGINSLLEGGEGEPVFEMYWRSEQKKDLVFGRFQADELENIGLVLLSKFKRLHLKRFQPLKMEERLYATAFDWLRLEGTPDFIGHLDGTLSVVDFKTSGYRYEREKPQTSLQLALYAYLAEKALGIKVERLVFMVFVKNTSGIQELDIPYSSEQAENFLREMMVTCAYTEQLAQYPRNFDACVRGSLKCEFIGECFGGSTQ